MSLLNIRAYARMYTPTFTNACTNKQTYRMELFTCLCYVLRFMIGALVNQQSPLLRPEIGKDPRITLTTSKVYES